MTDAELTALSRSLVEEELAMLAKCEYALSYDERRKCHQAVCELATPNVPRAKKFDILERLANHGLVYYKAGAGYRPTADGQRVLHVYKEA